MGSVQLIEFSPIDWILRFEQYEKPDSGNFKFKKKNVMLSILESATVLAAKATCNILEPEYVC